MTNQEVILQAQRVAAAVGCTWSTSLERLIVFGLKAPEYLPTHRNLPTDLSNLSYVTAYVRSYYKDRDDVIILKPSSTAPDPAVSEVLDAFAAHAHLSISSTQLEQAHRLSMTAENLIGKFLERYIASYLETKGWVWCCGSTLHAIDFLKEDGESYTLLQVKNRSNSENSSSSAIRKGTVIQKWYRITARSGKVHWDRLPGNESLSLTERGFHDYIREYVSKHGASS